MNDTFENSPRVVAVDEGSAAARHGITVGDIVLDVDGTVPRDVIEWHRLVDDPQFVLRIDRAGLELEVEVERGPGEPFGVTVSSAVFDRIHTCDNHCEFCFIYQLPKGMRRSLYTKDDDYRLSFLFGNFTTLTRFTEADLERVVDQRLSPLFVSIHATDPRVRSGMLRNERGGTSLRWLGQLLDAGIDVHGQIVLCPGVNDGDVLDDTLHTILEEHPRILDIAIVPLGLSRHNTEPRMRVHSAEECAAVVGLVSAWQERFAMLTGRPVVHAADEFWVRAGMEVPGAGAYDGYGMLEDGVGIVRSFVDGFNGIEDDTRRHDGGFFGSVDATAYVRGMNPAAETGLRRVQTVSVRSGPRRRPDTSQIAVVTGELGAEVIAPLVDGLGDRRVRVTTVRNEHFGGNTAVAGLMTFSDIVRTLSGEPGDTLFLVPDVCLNGDRFLDGHTVGELSGRFPVEVMPTSGTALRARLGRFLGGST